MKFIYHRFRNDFAELNFNIIKREIHYGAPSIFNSYVKKLLHDLSSRYKLSKTTHPISSLRSNQSEDWAFEFLWFDRARVLCKNIGIAIILHAARDDSGSPFIGSLLAWNDNATRTSIRLCWPPGHGGCHHLFEPSFFTTYPT